jgi:GntR family transcriptional regulator/MocR family aminotransferase
MVVPESLVDALAGARRALSGPPPEVSQAALATFIAEGHYGRHVRRMRALYEERREALVEALAQRVGGVASVRAVSGMHLVLRLESPDADAAAVARALRGQGVESIPVDAFADRPERPTELLLGYAGHPPEELRKGASALAKVLAAPRRA